MQTPTCTVRANGPLVIRGPIELIDDDGATFTVPDGDVVKLCRCGASLDKPFCDGEHSRAGFKPDTRVATRGSSTA